MSTIAYQDLTFAPRATTPTAPQAATRLRLTRRGRLVVFLAAAAVLAALTILLGTSVAATDDAAPTRTTTVQVQPGQTLWQIAAEANPQGDIRGTIDDIVRLNALPNASGLKMGTTLAVPVYED